MAMAATAAAVSVVAAPCVSTSFGVSSRECRSSRLQTTLVRNRSAGVSSVSCSVKAGCSSNSSSGIREAWISVSATSRLNSVGSNSSSSSRPRSREWRWQAVAEQLQASETEEVSEEGAFPSDWIAIFFEAEGSLPEASVGKLTSTLEAIEGVSGVDITASSDGTATVRLTKQMNVQATGVASGLVDVLLKGGFKLQALNLGFDEEDADDDDFYEYDVATSTDESEEAAEQI
ncbi:unnamed protein product [Calypogeia fissa]